MVAVGVVGDVEDADGGGAVRPRRAGGRIGIGVVVADLRLHRALERGALVLARDVVDRVVALAEAVEVGLSRRGVVLPARGGQPVEVVIDVALQPRPADGVAEAGPRERAGRRCAILQAQEKSRPAG